MMMAGMTVLTMKVMMSMQTNHCSHHVLQAVQSKSRKPRVCVHPSDMMVKSRSRSARRRISGKSATEARCKKTVCAPQWAIPDGFCNACQTTVDKVYQSTNGSQYCQKCWIDYINKQDLSDRLDRALRLK